MLSSPAEPQGATADNLANAGVLTGVSERAAEALDRSALRILHIMPHYWPAVRYGGPIRSVHGLAAATVALGHDVHVFTTNADGDGVSDVPTGAPVDVGGVKVWYFACGAGRRIFRSPDLGRALEDAIAAFDVVHIHYMWVWTTIRAAKAARSARVPYILSPRGMLVADLIRRRSGTAKRLWLALFGKRDIAEAAAIHVTSDVEASNLAELGLSTRRVAIIANGTEESAAVDAAQDPLDSGLADLDKPYILFLGRISWKKGLDRLLRALPNVRKADLVIAGYDEDDYQRQVEQLAAECGVADRVHFAGPVEGERKQRLLDGAACLVLPSYNENFGMVVVEAMQAGLPVVVTPEVGLASVVRETGSGIVAGGDPEQIAEALDRMVSDPAAASAMGEAGQRTARERYAWPTIAGAMVKLYTECLPSSSPASFSRSGVQPTNCGA